jgi:alpha/beta superfamily hydrolase
MNIPKIPTQTSPFLWGAAVGAVALAIAGFSWGGWMTGTQAEALAGARADDAIISALTPVCVSRFQKSVNAPASLVEMKKLDSWERSEYVTKAGWATMPGTTAESNPRLATACADAIDKLVM